MSDRYLGWTKEQLDRDHPIVSDDGWFCDTCRRPVDDGGTPGPKIRHTGVLADDFD